MTRAGRTIAPVALVAALVGLLAAPAVRAQPPNAPAPAQPQILIPGGGTELLRAFLDREGIQPVHTNDMRADDDLIVIVIGTTAPANPNWPPLTFARLALQVNGAALIATDSQTAFHEFDRNPDPANPITWISGAPVTANWTDCHQPTPNDRRDYTPYVVPVSPDEPDARLLDGQPPGRVWSLFRGLTKLATNDPSFFDPPREFRGEYQHPLARLPKSSRAAWGQRFKGPPLFAIGGDGPPRRGARSGYSFLAVADASVYINAMVMEERTDNLEFTLRTIEYLQGPDKSRKRCMFFENGVLVENFDALRAALAKPKAKIPPEAVPNLGPLFGKNQDKLIKFLDDKSDDMQSRDELHRTVIGSPGSQRERRNASDWIDRVAVLGGVTGISFLLRRALRARQPQDVPPAPNTGAGAASTGPPGVFDRRQRELVRRNNLYEPVRNLMREFFDGIGAPPDAGPRVPRVLIDRRAVRKPESLRQALHDMWRIAYGPPTHISAQRWFELEPYFNRLCRAHEDGKWRLARADEA